MCCVVQTISLLAKLAVRQGMVNAPDCCECEETAGCDEDCKSDLAGLHAECRTQRFRDGEVGKLCSKTAIASPGETI